MPFFVALDIFVAFHALLNNDYDVAHFTRDVQLVGLVP
jgi:hypothetical protein